MNRKLFQLASLLRHQGLYAPENFAGPDEDIQCAGCIGVSRVITGEFYTGSSDFFGLQFGSAVSFSNRHGSMITFVLRVLHASTPLQILRAIIYCRDSCSGGQGPGNALSTSG